MRVSNSIFMSALRAFFENSYGIPIHCHSGYNQLSDLFCLHPIQTNDVDDTAKTLALFPISRDAEKEAKLMLLEIHYSKVAFGDHGAMLNLDIRFYGCGVGSGLLDHVGFTSIF